MRESRAVGCRREGLVSLTRAWTWVLNHSYLLNLFWPLARTRVLGLHHILNLLHLVAWTRAWPWLLQCPEYPFHLFFINFQWPSFWYAHNNKNNQNEEANRSESYNHVEKSKCILLNMYLSLAFWLFSAHQLGLCEVIFIANYILINPFLVVERNPLGEVLLRLENEV